ncbi:hypothetical protein [Pseudanabaena sp. PCC 6802]|uniref:hypothetical protein n=1 Tax=Pseudanabaena sp. PCC 6802 TaxID=118173 RepID=UPI000346BCD1|nr:hypothetical protein [Pseudanabaena sp. PCC 6802]
MNLKLVTLPLVKHIRQYRIDIAIAISLSIAIAIATYFGTYAIPDPIFTDFYAQDVWFGSDIPTVFGNITSVNSDFGRNNKHPLFPLLVFPLVFAVSKLFHLEPLSAARIVAVGVSVLWVSSLYALFRVMGCYRLDATLFSLVGAVSAAGIFWLVIPESFSFGSLTIILGLVFVALTQFRSLSTAWYVAVNVLTVSITITNWMVGILATFANHRWRKMLQILAISLLVATGLWILQRIVFTNSGFPFQPGTFIGEKKFISTPGKGGILAVMSAIFFQTMVMPATQIVDFPIRPDWIKFDVNTLAPASGSWWGAIAVFSWTALLGLGVWGFFTTKQQPKLRLVLGLTLIAQVLMHSIYGVEETFLYSLHFIPLLLTLAAFGLFTRLRLLSLLLVATLIVSAGMNNRSQFSAAAATLWDYGTPQQQVKAQMKLRSSDPWPRGAGHVVLAQPGSTPEHKAFHEPGGSFSPQPGSFGVSIWVVDPQGNLKATSDSIPLSEIQQQFTDLSAQNVPGILTKTKYYEASWSAPRLGNWLLNLKSLAGNQDRLVVAIRSVGPAGGAIPSLDWDGNRLSIGDRWIVNDITKQAKVYLGSENTAGWSREQSSRSRWEDPYGWGYARIELNPGESSNLLISDRRTSPDTTSPVTGVTSSLSLELPDVQFTDSLKAQVSHLMMGLAGNRTYPSDPISYPLPRFRDGAYQMVALARAGKVELAKQLSSYFAENDFFNGNLPETDIPALGIWALEEVAIAIEQPDYDRWLWPHVQRKAKLIEDMLSSNRPGYPVLMNAKSPLAENPDLVRVDLIAGKMESVPGAISLDPAANAMSYRALLDAADLADRMKQPDDAKRWRSRAEQLKSAWQKANQTGTADLTNSLWPSGIAEGDRATLTQKFQERWEASRDATGTFRQNPPSMQAQLSEAHQWLLLGRPERLWVSLKSAWHNQASPGLYTWWGDPDGLGKEILPKSFSQWQRLRGWSDRSDLTPHYWTTAEMLLLQLDMLAYVDRSTSSPTLILGAGILPVWLKQPISVKGQLVEGNLVNWAWDGKQVTVQIKGKPMKVKAGNGFPAGTQVKVEHLPKKLPQPT